MNRNLFMVACLSMATALSSVTAHAGQAQDLGRHYAQKWRDSDEGYQDTSARIRLTLVEKGGASTDRFMRMNSFEMATKSIWAV